MVETVVSVLFANLITAVFVYSIFRISIEERRGGVSVKTLLIALIAPAVAGLFAIAAWG